MIFIITLLFYILSSGSTLSINASESYLPSLSNDLFNDKIVPFLIPPASKYLITLLCAKKSDWSIHSCCLVNKAWYEMFKPHDIGQAIYEYHILKGQPLRQCMNWINDSIESLINSTYLNGSPKKKRMISNVYSTSMPDVNVCLDLVENHTIYHLDVFSWLLMNVDCHKGWLACYELALKQGRQNKQDLCSITICYFNDLMGTLTSLVKSNRDFSILIVELENVKKQFDTIKNTYGVDNAKLVDNKKVKIMISDFLLDLLQTNQYERALFLLNKFFEKGNFASSLKPFFCREGGFKCYFDSNPKIFSRLIYDLIFKNKYENSFFTLLTILLSMPNPEHRCHRNDLYSLFMQETNDKYKKIVNKEPSDNLSDEELYFVLMSYFIALRFENDSTILATYPETAAIQKEILKAMSLALKQKCIENLAARNINKELVLKMQEALNANVIKVNFLHKCKKAFETFITKRVFPAIDSHIMSIVSLIIISLYGLILYIALPRVLAMLSFYREDVR
jgi:hypothetical protein